VKIYVTAMATVLAALLATPAQAAKTDGDGAKVERKTVVVTAGSDEGVLAQEGEDCKVITMTEDGTKKVIRLGGGRQLDADQKLDTAARLKLMDAEIAHLKATGQLRTDLAVKRVEVEKLELAGKPDAEVVARKKEINALKAQLADAEPDYEQTVKKLVPDDMYELYMLGIGDEADLLELNLSHPVGGEKRIIKRIEVRDHDDEERSD